jgi:hypothetical protein
MLNTSTIYKDANSQTLLPVKENGVNYLWHEFTAYAYIKIHTSYDWDTPCNMKRTLDTPIVVYALSNVGWLAAVKGFWALCENVYERVFC